MYARVARWQPFPDTPWVTEVGCTAPGVRAIFHVVDDQTGEGLAIAFADDLTAFEGAGAAIVAANEKRQDDRFTGSPSEVALYRVNAWTTKF